jgi:hypothetical protein
MTRAAYRSREKQPGRSPLEDPQMQPQPVTQLQRGVGQIGPFKRMTTIPQYLRFWAHTDRLWKIPSRLATKALRAVGNRFGLYQYWDS